MRHLRVLIVAADDLTTELLTEVAAFDLPLPAITTLQPATALDELETTVFTTGQAILRRLLQAAWEETATLRRAAREPSALAASQA